METLPDRMKATDGDNGLDCPVCKKPCGLRSGPPSYGDDYEPGTEFDCPQCGAHLVVSCDFVSTQDDGDFWWLEVEVADSPST